MNLDNINDIETLKKMLKFFLTECISDYLYNGHLFKKGEWYNLNQDEEGIDIYSIYYINDKIESKYIASMSYELAEIVFKSY